MTAKTKPREWTPDEVRTRFLEHLAVMVDYWARVPEKDLVGQPRPPLRTGETVAHRRLEGLAFSICTALDGCAVALPAFVVAPSPHPENRAFNIGRGENYYSRAGNVPGDIAGGLHEQWHKVYDGILPKLQPQQVDHTRVIGAAQRLIAARAEKQLTEDEWAELEEALRGG